ncbi:MAG: type II toxin-antitoxin system VapC family toxin [Acidimicrobiales bacterium]
MIVLDTTILVYAVGTEHPLRDPARALVASVRDGDLRATTTVEVVQEFAHVRARRRTRADAAARAVEYATGLSPLVQPDQEDLLEGLGLFRDAVHLGPFDAVLAATARRRGWALASADRSFGEVGGLVHLDPSSVSFLDQALAAG